MLNGKTFLAIIPARGGSKRLPRKNVLEVAGKPLIAWTIEAAKRCEYIDKVIVTSDDDEILKVSEKFGATTITRPADIAQDTSTSFDAIKHAIECIGEYDYTILLQPTSPLRTKQHIEEAIQLLFDKNADGVISVTEMEHSPLWANILPSDDNMSGFLKEEILNKRSQDLDLYYRLNGAIYISQTTKLMNSGSFFLSNNIYAYKMSTACSVDIDRELDLKWADFLLSSSIFHL